MRGNHNHLLRQTPEANLVAGDEMAVASTTTRRRWASERLGMGDDSRVMPAIGRLKRKGRPELARLEQVYENHNGEVAARIGEFRDLFAWRPPVPHAT